MSKTIVHTDAAPVSPYCSVPSQIDSWFKAFNRAKTMCGGSGDTRRNVSEHEAKYLNALVRGVYAKRDLPKGHELHHSRMGEDFYLAIPLQKGQLSCREVMNGQVLKNGLKADAPLSIDDIQGEYSENVAIRNFIYQRGL